MSIISLSSIILVFAYVVEEVLESRIDLGSVFSFQGISDLQVSPILKV